MTTEVIDEFVQATSTRIPNVQEMLSLCESLGIEFVIENGVTGIRAKAGVKEEAKILASLFRREPFRTEVLKAKTPQTPAKNEPVAEPEIESDEVIEKPSPYVPRGATIVVADKDAYTDKDMKGPPYQWCWYKGEQCSSVWFLIKDHPVPTMERQ